MGFVQGGGRTQGTLFPVCLEELIPDDHVCRVIDAFVGRLDMAGWDLSVPRRLRRGGLVMIRATF
jgi:transposase